MVGVLFCYEVFVGCGKCGMFDVDESWLFVGGSWVCCFGSELMWGGLYVF